MKKFTKLFLALALLVVGVGTANAEAKKYWEPSTAFGASWDGETNKASWTKNGNGWYLLYTGFTPKSNGNTTAVDYSLFSKLHATVSNLTGTASDSEGAYIEFKVRSTGKDDLNIKLREGENEIVFADWADKIDFGKLLEITLSGTLAEGSEAGSAVITEMYLYTDRYEYQKQEKEVRALGTALSLESVVSGSTLVSIAAGGSILYGKTNDGSQWGSNQILVKPFNEVMELISGDDDTSCQFKITEAKDSGLVMPEGITTLYRIKAFKADGTTPFIGPGWNGANSFFLQEISWTMNVADGTNDTEASFFAITPIEGKTNTYKITSYKKDGSKGYKDNIHNMTEWTFNALTTTTEKVDVLVEVFVPDTEDPGIPEVADGWISLITNGDLAEDDVTNFWTKNEDVDAIPIPAVRVADAGRMGGPGIKVTTKDNAGSDWGTQFFVKSSTPLKEGQKLHIEFDYRADRPQNAATQVHRAPGDYNANIDAVDFTVNWKHYSNEITITSEMCKQDGGTGDFYLQSFGLNLSQIRTTSNFYFDNIVMWTEDDPCKAERTALEKAIALGQAQHEDSKTATSFATLTQAIQDGQDVLESTDKTTLTNAAKAITDAISGLKYAAGYAKVTKNMFMTWDGDGADANATGVSPAGADNIGVENAGVPYGYGNGQVRWNHYTDLTPYEKLYAIGTKGKQTRYLFNRVQKPGDPNAEGGDFVEKKITLDNNGVAELTLSEVGDFAHLNTFKRPDDGTTFTEFFVYAEKTNVKVGNAGYATFSSIMNVDLSGVTGYAAKYNGTKVELTNTTAYPAGAAIIIEAAEGNYSLTNIESANAVDSDLKISDGSVAGDGTIYVLAKKSDVVGFYKLKDGEKVPAGKAYLKVANAGSREYIAIDGGATAIKSVETEKANGAIYNLAGQQVKNAQKGIFIMNGKKVIK